MARQTKAELQAELDTLKERLEASQQFSQGILNLVTSSLGLEVTTIEEFVKAIQNYKN